MEAAFVIPLVLVVLLAAVEVVALLGTHLEVVAAAREGARVAATTPDPAAAVEAVKVSLAPELAARVRVSVVRPAVVGRPAEVRVSVSRSLVTPLLGGIRVPVSSRAVMRVER